MTGLRGHWDVRGLPDGWPEFLAEALSELSDDEFDEAWRLVGEAIRRHSRRLRAEAMLFDGRTTP